MMQRRVARNGTPRFKREVTEESNPSGEAPSTPDRHEKVEVLPEPIKSVADKKLYRAIRLENGLTALLISDPRKTTEQGGSSDDGKLAACAISVGVGSFSDPLEVQGLAHFVEHMVFMGSEKYPKENEFDEFVQETGFDNAMTDYEMTTFFFEISEKLLSHGMDMFSQFFISPLMLKESMQREREAIESEFAMGMSSDMNRKDQLLASLFPEGHPARDFTWGNLKTLKEDIDDDTLYKTAHEFVKRHYSAHRMTVAVQAGMDLDTLEQYVINTFGLIKNNNLPPDDFSQYAFRPDMVTPEFKSLYYVKPVADTTEVRITWCMKPLINEYESKPHQYISFMLGSEGKGGLLSYLRKKEWALGITAGNLERGMEYTSVYSLFSAEIVLTQSGLEHVDEVIEAVYSYLNMWKRLGPSKQMFEEIKSVVDTNFRFVVESEPSDYVAALAQSMQRHPPEHYITGDRLYFKYDEKAIMELLDYMTPDMANVIVYASHNESIQYDQQEKWFGTEYKAMDVPKSWLSRWTSVEPYSDFHIPEKNIYIADNFDLVPPAEPYLQTAKELGVDLYNTTAIDLYNKSSHTPAKTKVLSKGDLMATVKNFRINQPNLLRKNHEMELWYKPDFTFRFPIALLFLYFISPLGFNAHREACLLDLWSDVLNLQLKEETYSAQMAGFSQLVYVNDKGLTLQITGYNQKIHLLADLVTRNMGNAVDNLTENMFEAIKEDRARTYSNIVLKPSDLAQDLQMSILLEPHVTPRKTALELQNVTLADLKDFVKKYLHKLYLQMYAHGNLAWDEAIHIADNVHSNIRWKPLKENEMPAIKVHQLPHGEKKLRVLSMDQDSPNSMIFNYYQAKKATPADTATLEVVMMQMNEPLFNTLRTNEQLGYSVSGTWRNTYGVLDFSVSVNAQANKFSTSYVNTRIEKFLNQFGTTIRNISDEDLRDAKQALVNSKHAADIDISNEAQRLWNEIVTQEYNFQRQFIEAEAIENVTRSDLARWVRTYFPSRNGTSFRKLSLQVVGHNITDAEEQPPVPSSPAEQYKLVYYKSNQPEGEHDDNGDDKQFITNIDKFKKNLPIIQVSRAKSPQG